MKWNYFLKILKEEIEADLLEDPENYWPISFISVPGMIMKQIILQNILKHMEDKEVIRDSKHGFTKGKLCLTSWPSVMNLIVSMDKVPPNIMCLDFCKAFAMIPHNSHVPQLEACRFGG